jgi:O-antigen/teichoic acid export membrane protein
MSVLSRLLKVGSITHSLSVYLPAMVLQKGLGLGRLVLLTYLLRDKSEMGHWGLGVMIFTLGAPLVTLGANHSLVRYVSVFEARGELRIFFRRIFLWILCLAFLLTAVLCLLSPSLLDALHWVRVKFHADTSSSGSAFDRTLGLIMLGNMAVMAVYLSMMSFMYGLRVYRLVSLVEVLFSVLFTVLAILAVSVSPNAFSLLTAHLGALVVTLVVGGGLLRLAVRRLSQPDLRKEVLSELTHADALEPATESDPVAADIPLGETPGFRPDLQEAPPFLRVVRFGLAAMIGTFAWHAAGYVSYLMTYLQFGGNAAGPLLVVMQLSQTVCFLVSAAWAVLFSHVARRWEHDDRRGAIFVLETAYKAVSLTLITLSVVLYVTAPLWIRMLHVEYQYSRFYLSGMLTFFVTVSNMTLLTILAKLHERPGIISIAALAGAAFNAVLAAWWMGPMGWHVVGAARAAGVGMFFGGGIVTFVYVQALGTRLHKGAYFVMAAPALLLLPAWVAGPLWAAVLAVCALTPWMFTERQRKVLRYSLANAWRQFRGVLAWR